VGTRIMKMTSCRVLYTTFGGKEEILEDLGEISWIVVYNQWNLELSTVNHIEDISKSRDSWVMIRNLEMIVFVSKKRREESTIRV